MTGEIINKAALSEQIADARAMKAENERLRDEIAELVNQISVLEQIVSATDAEHDASRARCAELEEGLLAFHKFHDYPVEAKRPDVFERLIRRARSLTEKHEGEKEE